MTEGTVFRMLCGGAAALAVAAIMIAVSAFGAGGHLAIMAAASAPTNREPTGGVVTKYTFLRGERTNVNWSREMAQQGGGVWQRFYLIDQPEVTIELRGKKLLVTVRDHRFVRVQVAAR